MIIPADHRRHPPGCPDPDWCRGNRECYWTCIDEGEPPQLEAEGRCLPASGGAP